MRTIRMLSSAVLVGAMAVVTPGGAASAASPTTYTGVFEGGILYNNCAPSKDSVPTTGTWSIVLKRTSANGTSATAKGAFDIFVNDVRHVSYVYPNMKLAPGWDEDSFSVSGRTAAGDLTVTLEDGVMTYTIAPYSLPGLSCTSVTYPGHQTS